MYQIECGVVYIPGPSCSFFFSRLLEVLGHLNNPFQRLVEREPLERTQVPLCASFYRTPPLHKPKPALTSPIHPTSRASSAKCSLCRTLVDFVSGFILPTLPISNFQILFEPRLLELLSPSWLTAEVTAAT